MKPVVYLVTNRNNGKVYVGWTVRSSERRFYRHCCEAVSGSSFYFHRAICKWGEDAFDVVDLCEADSNKQAKYLECLFIAALKTNDPQFGYNMTAGGQGGPGAKTGSQNPMFEKEFSPEHRRNLSVAHLGTKPSLGTRRKMSESHKGHEVSLETRQLLSTRKAGDLNPMKDPKVSEKVAKALRGKTQPADLNGRRSATMKVRWAVKKAAAGR
jgi:group I intron endonuclease